MGLEPLNMGGARRRSRTAVVGVAVVCFGLLGTAASVANAARNHKRDPKKVHVIEHAVTDTVIHSGGPTDVTGNTLTFHNRVYDPTDTTRVGHDQGFCMRISPADGSYECFWTTFLAHGQITVEGPFYDTKNSVLAITGGTGAYRDVRGQMSLKSRHGGSEYDFIFHIDS